MPAWQRGRLAVERMLESGELETVEPSLPTAERLLAAATAHIALAGKGVDEDPDGAFQLGYDAARKSCAALLAVQGLRATTHGGHVAVQEAVRDQFAGPNGMPVFGRLSRLRRQRNATEYPDPDSPTVTAEDAVACLAVAGEMLDAARRLVESGQLGRWA
ncbi:MAG TPA: hypothetical protein VK611_17765 [Acidimicrobiales bacterium]|nr:hypothetical protein [Acidimicrobiales bacterium]